MWLLSKDFNSYKGLFHKAGVEDLIELIQKYDCNLIPKHKPSSWAHIYTHDKCWHLFILVYYSCKSHLYLHAQFSSILHFNDFHICYWYTTLFKHNSPQYSLNLHINHTLFMFRLHDNFKYHPLSIT